MKPLSTPDSATPGVGPIRRNEGAPPKPRRVRIEDLLGGGRELIIEHRNEEYRLRMTSNSKLILTK
jgi:hemin uptake protein HemP